MIDSASINGLFGAKVLDVDGEKIGSVKQVFVGPDGGKPLFVSVATGLFGTSETFVPLRGATFDGEAVRVSYDKARVKNAPRIDADGSLSDDEHDRLWEYYDDDADDERDDDRGRDRDYDDDAEARERIGSHDPSETDGVARAEHAAGEDTANGRVRLRKHVVTEMQHIAVPVQHEEVRVERLPGTGAETDAASPESGFTGRERRRDDAGGRGADTPR